MPAFRRTLALSFAYKFFVSAALELGIKLDSTVGANLDSEITDSIHRQISSSSRDNSDPYALETVGRQFPHNSGLKHVTGEAVYIDDMPSVGNEAFAGLVLSTRAHAKILSVDPRAALEQEGVLAFVDHRDLPNERANYWGSAAIDEVFFAVDEVISHGQIIGAVVAKNRIIASKAAKLVKIEYEDLPVVLTIEEVSAESLLSPPTRWITNALPSPRQAIEQKSFHPQYNRRIARGIEIETALAESDFVLEGMTRMGGQEHFYLEVSHLPTPARIDISSNLTDSPSPFSFRTADDGRLLRPQGRRRRS